VLSRPGSEPGPEWMRGLAAAPKASPDSERVFGHPGAFWVIQVAAIVVADVAVYRAHGWHARSYESPIQIAGMPLLSMGRTAHGVITCGGVATGIVAISGVTAGVIAFGAASVGVFSFGALSVGILVLAAVAIGWRAVGAVAVGHATLGAVAIGRYAYGPGMALGYHQASGKQKESLFG
jgi:hypothetical protein